MTTPVSLTSSYGSVATFSDPSPGLKKFLHESTVVGERGVKPEGFWQMVRGFYAEATTEISLVAKDKYIESSEETEIAGTAALLVTPKSFAPLHENKVIVYIHGGAFVIGSAKHLYQVFAQVAFETGLKTIAIDYPLAPEAPFPKGLDQCFAVYQELLKTYQPENIVFLGDSAGGNLCIATALKAKMEGIQVPGALALFSPVTSAYKGESYDKNKDPRITYEETIEPAFADYTQEKDHPLFTILNADLSGLPPLFTQTGTRDALESDSLCLVSEITRVGGSATCVSLSEVPHGIVEQSENIPEGNVARNLAAQFIKERLGI
ncbi:MAG: alpha/beta hydrolase fold domain-containing protein [Chlamydiales bacterium]|nr:alpha/beta hydrolase fold domain-containing protein [Chlamydiales bacterium]